MCGRLLIGFVKDKEIILLLISRRPCVSLAPLLFDGGSLSGEQEAGVDGYGTEGRKEGKD